MPEGPPGTVLMICGGVGAGKTTYAAALAARLPGLALCLDEWMGRLFWPDAVSGEDEGWALERIERCIGQMRSVMAGVVPLGVPVAVDAGFTTRAERAAFAGWADAQGWPVALRWLDLDAETRWTRVLARNAGGGGGTGFEVTRAMFDHMETLWEPPDAKEMAAWSGRRIGAAMDS